MKLEAPGLSRAGIHNCQGAYVPQTFVASCTADSKQNQMYNIVLCRNLLQSTFDAFYPEL